MFERGEVRRWRNSELISWHVGKVYSSWKLDIPPGREFESSVPSWLTWILDPDDPDYLLSALLHDYFLEEGYNLYFAASAWYDAALSSGAPPVRSFIYSLGVLTYTLVKRALEKKENL